MVYRNRAAAVSFLAWGAVILGIRVLIYFMGDNVVEESDTRDEGWGFLIAGAVFALIGIAKLGKGFRMYADGITRMSWFGLGDQFHSWESLQSWNFTQAATDESTYWRVEFECVGKTWLFWVNETDVGFPAIHKFVEDVRSHAGAKEVWQQAEAVAQ